jgi:hypothetical protein
MDDDNDDGFSDENDDQDGDPDESDGFDDMEEIPLDTSEATNVPTVFFYPILVKEIYST